MSGPTPFLALQNGSKMNTTFQRAEKPKLSESAADLQEVCGSQEFLTLGVDSHPNRGWWGLGKHFLVRTFRFLLLSSLVSSVCRPYHYKTFPWRKSKSSAVEVADSSLMSENGPANWKQYSHPKAPLTPPMCHYVSGIKQTGWIRINRHGGCFWDYSSVLFSSWAFSHNTHVTGEK